MKLLNYVTILIERKNDMNPKISIIVPVYNVEKYIHKCVDSILNQTFKDFELILIDDGSTDSSGKICDEYGELDERVIVIHKENGGQSTARNAGINIARGEYIGFVDSDDWIEVDMYKILYDTCVYNDADMCLTGVNEVDEGGIVRYKYIPKDIIFSDILKRAHPWNKLFRRELFLNNNLLFYEGKYYEDLELIPKLYLKSSKVSVAKDIGYNYLRRSDSTTGSKDEKILDLLWGYIRIKDYIIQEDLSIDYRYEFDNGVIYLKSFYIDILYRYPVKFLLKNFTKIKRSLRKLTVFDYKDIFKFIINYTKFKFNNF